MKKVDSNDYISILKNAVEEGKGVSLIVSGTSMSPFLIHMRDYIYFEKPNRELRKGDMVFYQRENGEFVMHRICKIREKQYFMVGDAQQKIEGPIKRKQIFAIVIKVKRKGQWIESGNFVWDFFAYVWINMIPVRRMAIGFYEFIRKGKIFISRANS